MDKIFHISSKSARSETAWGTRQLPKSFTNDEWLSGRPSQMGHQLHQSDGYRLVFKKKGHQNKIRHMMFDASQKNKTL